MSLNANDCMDLWGSQVSSPVVLCNAKSISKIHIFSVTENGEMHQNYHLYYSNINFPFQYGKMLYLIKKKPLVDQ